MFKLGLEKVEEQENKLPASIGFPGGSDGKESTCMRKTQVQSLGQEDPLEKGMTTHSSILAWRIPWTEEPVGLQSVSSQSWTQLSDFHFFTCHKNSDQAPSTQTQSRYCPAKCL